MKISNRLCQIHEGSQFVKYSEALKTETMKKRITIKDSSSVKMITKKKVNFKENFVDNVEIESYKDYNYQDIQISQKKSKYYCKCCII